MSEIYSSRPTPLHRNVPIWLVKPLQRLPDTGNHYVRRMWPHLTSHHLQVPQPQALRMPTDWQEPDMFVVGATCGPESHDAAST